MASSRLSLGLEGGHAVLPDEGQIAVFAPRSDTDLSALPKDRVVILTGFKPDHDAWTARGYDTQITVNGPFAASLVILPRAKDQARALIAEAMDKTQGTVIIDGLKTDGVDSLYKQCRKRANPTPSYSKAHGKLFTMPSGDALSDWAAPDQPAENADGFQTMPGVFSADGIDRGSACLAEALPAKLPKRIADLGAGWGYLASEILKYDSVAELHLIEADHAALECAKLNITDPRAHFHWADATRFTSDPFDMVISNPPFHTTRVADPGLGQAFLQAAAGLLKPKGVLLIVANRHLPYETALNELFRDVTEIGGNSAFKVIRAHIPRPKS
ncbi:class I SAM-dependent methyltransferase [Parasulfitobacter algicola]|uniref:Class I SAM-dependent methyltransferase n=1 Tax=Parasulfitobacter algicola TaxID=2614809 RepID=A0ABX2IVT3_9RHOB|nr:methyltransferase [Sulfitobacter algicola]NSX54298.1 class I SAM-dependent methyltransferase [Sulfitobacter algicola]